jgi:uncharacterized protein YbaR (Trm112 family)
VTLDETDRLLACPFCRTRLYLIADGPFRYRIPPAAGTGGKLFYIPYWRLRGASFWVTGANVGHRFVDTSALAVRFPSLPASLGLRPQVLKLRYLTEAETGSVIAPDPSIARTVPGPETDSEEVLHRQFIGETRNLIHAPLYLRDGVLYDAVLGRPVSPCRQEELEALPTAALPRGGLRFVATLCPHCGRDMEGERDSLVLICRNCNSAWSCPGDAFTREEFAVLPPPPETKPTAIHLPFWRMKPRIEGMPLTSYADLIRTANLPKAVIPAYETAPLYFWSPAFKVNPALYLRWARQMTVFRPEGDRDESLPGSPLYPVTLPVSEAAEGILITLAQLIADKRKIPQLAEIRLSLAESRLEYHPFVLERNELRHPQLGVTLDRTALAYGIRM